MWSFLGLIGLVIIHPAILIIAPAIVICFLLLRWAVKTLDAAPPAPALPISRSVIVTPRMTGVDYEHAVARSLSAGGWQTETTKASGDQGLDVLARSGHRRVAIQCKKYSKPVGNRAVQEAYSAKGIYGATHAAVVTNTQFTRSAVEAAAKLGVVLLHHDDLPRLGSLLGCTPRELISAPRTERQTIPATPKVNPLPERFRRQFKLEKAAPDLQTLAEKQRAKIVKSRETG
jgi:hypothetical protein